MCHISCHVPSVKCQVSDVRCQVSGVRGHVSFVTMVLDKVMELVGGGSVIKEAYPV